MPATKSTTPASPLFNFMADLNRAQFASYVRPMGVDPVEAPVKPAFRTEGVFAEGGDVCRSCGRFLPEEQWNGDCPACAPSPAAVAEAEEEKAFDALAVEIKSQPSAFASRFLALVERVEKIEASVSGLIGREIL